MSLTYQIGIGDDKRNKMNTLFADKSWKQKVIDWTVNNPDNTGATFGMLAFGRSLDGKYADSVYISYKMDVHAEQKNLLPKSWWTRIISHFFRSTENAAPTIEHMLGNLRSKEAKNFFRLKALEECYNEGLVEKIKYVNSLEDTS